MKGLQQCIGVSVVHPTWQRTRPENPNDTHHGWCFLENTNLALHSPSGMGSFVVEGCTNDPINGVKFIRDLYVLNNDILGKYSVPILWDKTTNTIVNNESSEIIRMINSEFNEFTSGPCADVDLYPENLRTKIDEVNAWVYPTINNGVYKCGFAKLQQAYDEAVTEVFEALEKVECILSESRYLAGNSFTEADLRLFMTLVRFDEVYVVYFKTNIRCISSYHNIRNYCRDIYQLYGMADSIDMTHIKTHYFTSHPTLNHYAIIPKGPNVIADLTLPHDRERNWL